MAPFNMVVLSLFAVVQLGICAPVDMAANVNTQGAGPDPPPPGQSWGQQGNSVLWPFHESGWKELGTDIKDAPSTFIKVFNPFEWDHIGKRTAPQEGSGRGGFGTLFEPLFEELKMQGEKFAEDVEEQPAALWKDVLTGPPKAWNELPFVSHKPGQSPNEVEKKKIAQNDKNVAEAQAKQDGWCENCDWRVPFDAKDGGD